MRVLRALYPTDAWKKTAARQPDGPRLSYRKTGRSICRPPDYPRGLQRREELDIAQHHDGRELKDTRNPPKDALLAITRGGYKLQVPGMPGPWLQETIVDYPLHDRLRVACDSGGKEILVPIVGRSTYGHIPSAPLPRVPPSSIRVRCPWPPRWDEMRLHTTQRSGVVG